jgi:hypothetical protein
MPVPFCAICAHIRPLDYFYAAPMIERGKIGALVATVFVIDEVREHGSAVSAWTDRTAFHRLPRDIERMKSGCGKEFWGGF